MIPSGYESISSGVSPGKSNTCVTGIGSIGKPSEVRISASKIVANQLDEFISCLSFKLRSNRTRAIKPLRFRFTHECEQVPGVGIIFRSIPQDRASLIEDPSTVDVMQEGIAVVIYNPPLLPHWFPADHFYRGPICWDGPFYPALR